LTTKVQSFLKFDSSSLANYKNWAQGIGTALSSLGWVQTADTGQVTWGNVVAVPGQAPIASSWNPVTWTANTTYTGVAGGSTGAVTAAIRSGLTYACISTTTPLVLTQALQNTATSLSVTGNAAASAGNTNYTVVSSTGAVVGQQYIVTGMGNAANNGTFIVTAVPDGTHVTLSNPNGILSTAQSGTMASVTSVLTFLGTITGGASNALVGYTFTTTGFANSPNNITFTVTSSSAAAFACTATGTNETHAGSAAWGTPPETDTIHWTTYNYELWGMADSASSTSPFYVRFVYSRSSGSPLGASIYASAGIATTGTGFVSGQTFTSAGAEFTLPTALNLNGQGNTTFECDFCVSATGGSLSIMMWRDAVFTAATFPWVLVFDRAKDNFGVDLDAYIVCLMSSNGASAQQMLYKAGGGGTKIPNSTTPFTRWSVPNFNAATTLSFSNNAPVLPIFPVGLGYLASPCLGAVVFKGSDCVEGSLIPVFMYGAAHTFLIGKGGYTTADQGSGGAAVGIGIRWE
jgi:hypothetical protein